MQNHFSKIIENIIGVTGLFLGDASEKINSSYENKEMNKYCKQIQSIISDRGLHRPLDIALVGATGVGKSSTLNQLFGSTVAKVGFGVAPETQEISQYEVNGYFRLHDTAGLGDGLDADKRHANNLTELLLRTFDNKNYHLIDLALVILDGSQRDMGTTYKILEQVVLKCIDPKRVIVAINQADMAMKGRYWDSNRCRPEPILKAFLDEKIYSVKNRILEATRLSITLPVYYSAYRQYNLDKLMEHIIAHMPHSRRLVK